MAGIDFDYVEELLKENGNGLSSEEADFRFNAMIKKACSVPLTDAEASTIRQMVEGWKE